MSKSRSAAFFGALTILVSACGDRRTDAPPPPEQSPTPKSPAAPAPAPSLGANEEMTLLIRALWPIARESEGADWDWAGCHDKMKGYADVRACLDKAAAAAKAAQAKMPLVNAKTDCGKSVAEAHRTFVDNRVKHLDAYAAWMDKNAAALQARMATLTLWEAERNMKPPVDLDLGLVTITQNARNLAGPRAGQQTMAEQASSMYVAS